MAVRIRPSPSLREIIRAETADGVSLALTHVTPRISAGTAVLLIHGFGQNRYLLDLPGRSLAEYLAAAGFDAYVLELRGHGLSRGRGACARSIVDYADLDLPAAVEAIRARGARHVYLVGHSLGGVTCMAAPPEMLRSVRGVVTMASPTHFGVGALNVRMISAVATQLLAVFPPPRALPTEVMAVVFRRWLTVFNARLPFPMRFCEPGQIEGELLRQYLATGFDREATGVLRDLARWCRRRSFDRVPGRECIRERLRAFPAPILFMAGKQDRLVPPSSMRPGFEGTRAPRKSWRLYGGRGHRGRYGHVDLVLSRHAPNEVWPDLLAWLRS